MAITVAPERTTQDTNTTVSRTIHYPESDGKPVGETDFHIAAIFYLRAALRAFYRHVADRYVAANMLFYYEEGEPTIYKVPDVFVVKGISKEDRRVYKLWAEKTAPCVIFEITSRSTRWEDTGEKKGLYAELGVREYFLFDPLGEYLKPRLQGFRLVQGAYQPMLLAPNGTLNSAELGLILQPSDNLLRLVDPATGEAVPTLDEAIESKVEAEARAQSAEAELARLRQEMVALKRQLGQQ